MSRCLNYHFYLYISKVSITYKLVTVRARGQVSLINT